MGPRIVLPVVKLTQGCFITAGVHGLGCDEEAAPGSSMSHKCKASPARSDPGRKEEARALADTRLLGF